MRRIIPALLALTLTLAACGAPSAEVTPSASPEPTPVESAEPVGAYRYPYSSSPSNLEVISQGRPYYLPPMDFAPVSVWRAEPFGSGGKALLYMGAEKNGSTPFKLYFCFNQDRGTYPAAPGNLVAYCFASELVDGKFSYDCDTQSSGSEILPITGVDGSFDFSGNRLTLSYDAARIYGEEHGFDARVSEPRIVLDQNDTGFVRYISFPTEFTRVYDDYIGYVMRSMPVFYEELVYAPNSGETAALYDERGEGYTSSDPEIAPTLRGLEIGDSLNDILLSIPVEVYMDYDGGTMYLDPAQITLGEAGLRLYGGVQDISYYASLYYTDGRPGHVLIHCLCATYISFELDEAGNISAATYYQWNPQ